MNFLNDLIDQMACIGLYTDHIELSEGKYHRFKSRGECKKKCCGYRIFEQQKGAHLICYRRNIDVVWFSGKSMQIVKEDRIFIELERERIESERRLNQQLMAHKSEVFFNSLWHKDKIINHLYVNKKRIFPHYAKLCRNTLILAVRDINYQIQSLQGIRQHGFKQFKSGARAKVGMIWLCEELSIDYIGVIRICEGWSTGCSIHEITKSPVICALNANNLLNVAIALRRKYCHAIIKICADNDAHRDDNIGLRKALEASKLLATTLHYPVFNDVKRANNPTDYNDLYLLTNKEEVKRQLITIR
jgi:putative DNA primase/helicase